MSENDETERLLLAAGYFEKIGNELENGGELEAAKKYYCKAIECYGEALDTTLEGEEELYEKIGDMYRKIGNHMEAIRSYERALALGTDNEELIRKLALQYYFATSKLHSLTLKENYYYKSERLFRRYLDLHPGDGSAWIWLGEINERLKDYTEALKCYEKALGMEPNNTRALSLAAKLQRRVGNHEEAISLYKKRQEIDNSHHPLWGIAETYAEMGDYEKAIAYMKQAVDKTPSSWALWEQLEEYYAHTGDYEKAEQCRKKSKEIKRKAKEQY